MPPLHQLFCGFFALYTEHREVDFKTLRSEPEGNEEVNGNNEGSGDNEDSTNERPTTNVTVSLLHCLLLNRELTFWFELLVLNASRNINYIQFNLHRFIF